MASLLRSIRRVFAVRRKTIYDDLDEFDEKHIRWPSRHLRLPRLRRVTVGLMLFDLLIVGAIVLMIEPLITQLRYNDKLFGAHFVFPSGENVTLAAAAAQSTDRIEIPKILHQTSASSAIPDAWVYPQQSCRKAYSDFEYKHWTDDLARAFISIEYPWFLHIWDSYTFPIQRADSIRYFVLHHFGGIYLDMDTLCKEAFPISELNPQGGHYALFKSTKPTGVTNDFMISTARHPAYTTALTKLPTFFRITNLWARLEPYAAIMLSSGPLFLSLAVQEYLLGLPQLPSPTINVVRPDALTAYITDLESSTWHRNDTHLLMWLGERPWTWYTLGVIGLAIGLTIVNRLALMACKLPRKIASMPYALKLR